MRSGTEADEHLAQAREVLEIEGLAQQRDLVLGFGFGFEFGLGLGLALALGLELG